jgi:site-specific DNA recombinase
MTTRNVTIIPARKRIGNSAKAEELPKLHLI